MNKPITPTALAYYHVCLRKLWLSSNSITMEQNSDLVYEGKLIGEHSYPQRAAKYTELQLQYAKIDYYDAKEKIVHEVKKSDKMEAAHIAQVQYYLYLLENEMGVDAPRGIIEYPKLRETTQVAALTTADRVQIVEWLKDIENILSKEACPSKLEKKSKCSACSYFDFCWSDEVE